MFAETFEFVAKIAFELLRPWADWLVPPPDEVPLLEPVATVKKPGFCPLKKGLINCQKMASAPFVCNWIETMFFMDLLRAVLTWKVRAMARETRTTDNFILPSVSDGFCWHGAAIYIILRPLPTNSTAKWSLLIQLGLTCRPHWERCHVINYAQQIITKCAPFCGKQQRSISCEPSRPHSELLRKLCRESRAIDDATEIEMISLQLMICRVSRLLFRLPACFFVSFDAIPGRIAIMQMLTEKHRSNLRALFLLSRGCFATFSSHSLPLPRSR